MSLQQVEEWSVAVDVGLLEDAVEVADRLVIMQDEDEAYGGVHRVVPWGWRTACGL